MGQAAQIKLCPFDLEFSKPKSLKNLKVGNNVVILVEIEFDYIATETVNRRGREKTKKWDLKRLQQCDKKRPADLTLFHKPELS